MISQLLLEMDNIPKTKQVIVLAATNTPQVIDPSFLRSGRFDEIIEIGEPDLTDREEIFRIILKKMKISEDVNVTRLAEISERFTGADIKSLCHSAGQIAVQRNLLTSEITMCDFENAVVQHRLSHARFSSSDSLISNSASSISTPPGGLSSALPFVTFPAFSLPNQPEINNQE
jgi:transitional endoplasmic reticulum ATPase